MNTEITTIREYLEAWVVMKQKFTTGVRPINGYCSLEDFILKHGKNWTPAPRPKGYRLGPIKMCYCNAATLAMSRGLTYCEGYATSLIPVMHAWCVDGKGNVIDITWRKPAAEYFGIAFRTQYLIRSLARNGFYGLVDAWQSGWPLIKDKVELWKHPRMNERTETHERIQ